MNKQMPKYHPLLDKTLKEMELSKQHRTTAPIIYEFDLLRKTTPSVVAERMESDFRFDKYCQQNNNI